jgi:hypothetical protein
MLPRAKSAVSKHYIARGGVIFLTPIIVTITNLDTSNSLQVDEQDCVKFFQTLTAATSDCYGKEHSDSRGGTWQVDSDAYYIALPGKKVSHLQRPCITNTLLMLSF